MRRGPALALLLALANPASAQQQADAADGPTPVLTISPDRLFAGTRYGRAAQARIDEAARMLQDENRRSERELAAEEQGLTNQRASLPPADFRVLAEAFDRKANGIRETQTAKARAIAELRERERQRFFQAVLPVLGQIMTDNDAVAIIDQATVFLSFDRIDITTIAIARIDTLLGAGPDAPIVPAIAPSDDLKRRPAPDALPLGIPAQQAAPGSPRDGTTLVAPVPASPVPQPARP